MTEPLQVGQFAIVDHEPVDRGPNAGTFHGRGPAGDRAELYILAEGTTPAGDSFAGHVVSAVGQGWASFDMSLTGALRRVFQEAERNLRDWNRKSIAQHRVSLGVACFGRRGPQAVIAQAGPSAAYHLSGGEIRTYFADEEHARAIGLGGTADPQLSRISFGPGDRLLLISTAALRELDDEVVGGILALPADKVLPDLYHRLRELRNLTAMLVIDPRGDDQAVPDVAAIASPPTEEGVDYVIDATAAGTIGARGDVFQASLFIGDDGARVVELARERLLDISRQARVRAIAPATRAEAPPPLRRAAGDSAVTRLADEGQARMAEARAMGAGARLPIRGAAASFEPAERRRPRNGASFSRGLIREGPAAGPPPSPSPAPLAEDVAREVRSRVLPPVAMVNGPGVLTAEGPVGSGAGGPVVRVRPSMGGRWKGGGTVRRGTVVGGSQPPTWLVVAIGVALLVLLAGALTAPGLLNGDESQDYAKLIDQAQRELATAQVQQDPAARRTALTEAQALLLEAKQSSRADDEVERLMGDVTSALAAMDAITSPASVQQVGSLAQFGSKPVTVARLAIGPTTAYLLDSNSSQVIAMSLATGEAKTVFSESKEAGRARPVAGALMDSPELGTPGYLIADTAKNLWAYSPADGLRQVPFAAPANMTITDIATSGRNLYVLDAGQSTIFRFTPGDNGYSQPPVKVLETPDLAAGRRFLVDGDEIFTSDANGALHWFGGQVSLALSQAGIDERLASPEAPQLLGKNGDIAVPDPRKNRVVIFHRDGTFVRQFRHKDFDSLAALAIRDGQAYVFSGGVLRKVTW